LAIVIVEKSSAKASMSHVHQIIDDFFGGHDALFATMLSVCKCARPDI
jgi:hypothetical protein